MVRELFLRRRSGSGDSTMGWEIDMGMGTEFRSETDDLKWILVPHKLDTRYTWLWFALTGIPVVFFCDYCLSFVQKYKASGFNSENLVGTLTP
jgi:hypothetical protein